MNPDDIRIGQTYEGHGPARRVRMILEPVIPGGQPEIVYVTLESKPHTACCQLDTFAQWAGEVSEGVQEVGQG